MSTPLPGELDLLSRSAKGDADAFGKLVSHYQNDIFNLVCRMIGNKDDAMDITQETFISAYKNIGAFEGRSKFNTWLYSIATNRAISAMRAKGSRPSAQMSALEGDDGRSAFEPAAKTNTPVAQLEVTETQLQVQQAISELEEDYKTVVVLRDIQGLDYEEIGEVLNCSIGTVKSRLHRARTELRTKLAKML